VDTFHSNLHRATHTKRLRETSRASSATGYLLTQRCWPVSFWAKRREVSDEEESIHRSAWKENSPKFV
jgi:hypothetical protein